ncbi:MAG: hypothetical protein AAFV29_27535, partial [Myxococcota bacterium]
MLLSLMIVGADADLVRVTRTDDGPPWARIQWSLTTEFDADALPGLDAALAHVWRIRASAFVALAGTIRTEVRPGQIVLSAGLSTDLLLPMFGRITERLL